MLYTSRKTLHTVCQLHFHGFRDKLLNELQYKSSSQHKIAELQFINSKFGSPMSIQSVYS